MTLVKILGATIIILSLIIFFLAEKEHALTNASLKQQISHQDSVIIRQNFIIKKLVNKLLE